MIGTIADLIYEKRWTIIVCAILFVVSMSVGLKDLYFNNDYRHFFSSDDPDIIANEKFQDIYSRDDSLLLAVESPDGFFNEGAATMLKQLTDSIWTMPYVSRVTSLANYQHIEAEGNDIIIDDFFANIPETDAEWKKVIEKAKTDNIISNLLLSKDRKVTLINVVILKPPGPRESAKAAIVIHDAVEAYLDKIRKDFPKYNFYQAGLINVEWAFSKYSERDLSILIPVMFVVMSIALFVLLRSWTATFLSITVVLLSIPCLLGLAGHLGLSINGTSAVTPEIVIAVGIAGSVHLLVTFLKELRLGKDKREAFTTSLKNNLFPNFISALTTSIGFFTLLFQTPPSQKELGLLSGAGVLIAFLLSVTLMPALMIMLPLKVDADKVKHAKSSFIYKVNDVVAGFAIKNRVLILIGSIAFVFIIVHGLTLLSVNNQWYSFFSKSTSFRQASDFIDQRTVAGIEKMDISIESGRPEGIKSVEYIRKLETLQKLT